MALSYAERIAQVAEHFAWHASHGYSQPHRGSGNTETVKLSDGSVVAVSNSDLDCSEMARQCVNCALSGIYTTPIPSMWTGNENERLLAQGFTRLPFSTSSVRRGDVLLVKGHTGVALGNGRQADAHGDEYGGITGPSRGDQTGHEIEVRSLRTNWTYIYRKEEPMQPESKLVTSTSWSPKHSGPRNHAFDTLTPHFMDGYSTGKACADYLRDTPSRTASATFFIGYLGDICQQILEGYRPWTSSSSANDNRAITIECANYMKTENGHVYGQLPDATWKSLVNLCADILRRHGKKRLVYRGKVNYSGLASTDVLLTKHKWFAATNCPGPWLDNQFDRLANEVNALLAPPTQKPGKAENNYGLKYRAHQQALGWLPAVHDGQVAGITGNALRLEAFKITPPDGVVLDVLAHIQGVGDKTYRGIRKGASSGTGSSKTDPIIGTVGKQRRIEGFQIDVVKNTNKALAGKQLYYRVHIQKQGWSKWVKAGTYAGTRGKQLRIEAIQMVFR